MHGCVFMKLNNARLWFYEDAVVLTQFTVTTTVMPMVNTSHAHGEYFLNTSGLILVHFYTQCSLPQLNFKSSVTHQLQRHNLKSFTNWANPTQPRLHIVTLVT